MKKTIKSNEPVFFNTYRLANPQSKWDEFRNNDGGQVFSQTRMQIFNDQGLACAYCEESLKTLIDSGYTHKIKVEHYHSKSDESDVTKNWNLDWNNLLGVCSGSPDHTEGLTKKQRLENLSCDTHKAHLEQKKKLPLICEGWYLNPLELTSTLLIKFDKATGELIPNTPFCETYTPIKNNYDSVARLIEETIIAFNLNCDRLVQKRKSVFFHYMQLLKKAKDDNDEEFHENILKHWLSPPWPSFFTTRRTLLGDMAEKYLEQFEYNG
ncbi:MULTISPECIES: TIGR02646 family protein [Aeromonas]|uniref:TIGR02646 family protein n=1 Tax=Aeromonas TaxID=642 RepID=UPI0012E0BFA5|nr:TIGR02646 family protein [Aeromonas dhakensis]